MTTGVSEQPPTVKLAGREFEMTGPELTAAQENFMQGQMRAAGVTEILSKPGANLNDNGEQILTALLVSGRDVYVIAGMLVEVGKRWRFQDACINAEAFADCTERGTKLTLQTILFGCVRGFFGQEGKSLLIFPNYSNAIAHPAPAQDGVSAAHETLDNLHY
jgi:hypothetical protein